MAEMQSANCKAQGAKNRVEQNSGYIVLTLLPPLAKPLFDGHFSESYGPKKDFFVRDFNATFASLFLKGVWL